jgi:hypothetical protein
VWIAELRGTPVGFAAVAGERLEHLYVSPEAQGKGVGAALLTRVKRQRSCLGLHVFQQNTDAIRFYERPGFVPVEFGDGSANEENLPDAHYRWSMTDLPEPPGADGLNDSLTCAFPHVLADDVAAARAIMPPTAHGAARSFSVLLPEDRVCIPERIYNPEPEDAKIATLTPIQQTILHCLYTRHHNGFVRRRHLAHLLASLLPWAVPYIVRLLGEYVAEIVTDINDGLPDLTTPKSPTARLFGRFAADNPDFIALTKQRAGSYWACYHMSEWPLLADYPGYRLMANLDPSSLPQSLRQHEQGAG